MDLELRPPRLDDVAGGSVPRWRRRRGVHLAIGIKKQAVMQERKKVAVKVAISYLGKPRKITTLLQLNIERFRSHIKSYCRLLAQLY